MRLKDYGRNQKKRKEYIQADFYKPEWMLARLSIIPV